MHRRAFLHFVKQFALYGVWIQYLTACLQNIKLFGIIIYEINSKSTD